MFPPLDASDEALFLVRLACVLVALAGPCAFALARVIQGWKPGFGKGAAVCLLSSPYVASLFLLNAAVRAHLALDIVIYFPAYLILCFIGIFLGTALGNRESSGWQRWKTAGGIALAACVVSVLFIHG